MTKSSETLTDEVGKDLTLPNKQALVYGALPENMARSPPHLLSLAGDGIKAGAMGHCGNHSGLQALSSVHRGYTWC